MSRDRAIAFNIFSLYSRFADRSRVAVIKTCDLLEVLFLPTKLGRSPPSTEGLALAARSESGVGKVLMSQRKALGKVLRD